MRNLLQNLLLRSPPIDISCKYVLFLSMKRFEFQDFAELHSFPVSKFQALLSPR